VPDSERPKLFADAMLGRLARWLRLLGLDVAYAPELDDGELVERAVAEGRLLLTRDRRLLLRRKARGGMLVRSEVLEDQVLQVVAQLGLSLRASRLFTRCVQCNLPLEEVSAAEARRRVPAYVARTQSSFRRCPGCRRIYWRASHVERMMERMRRMGLRLQVGIDDSARVRSGERSAPMPERSSGSRED
jgi:uncharacterized protein with PIN domain